jgi:small subunit ribosomal protein S1
MDFETTPPTETGENQVSEDSRREGGEPEATPTQTATAGEVSSSKAMKLNERLGLEVETLETGERPVEQDENFEQMMLQYEATLKIIKEGEIVKGTIIQVRDSDVQVNVGFKSEGFLSLSQFGGAENVKEGDEVDVFLESLEDENGLVVLSKEKADFLKVWDQIKETYDAGGVIEGTIDRRIKGGLVVKLVGVDAFLPGSQVALRQVPDLEALIGQNFEFKIIKLNKRRRNIVISRRVVLEEERNKLKAALIEELEKGQVRTGTVKNITDFGAFVDLGGIDGLLHLTDMSWGRVSHPSELVNIGEDIDVKVLDIDLDRERISLGLKQLTPYPWENVEEKYKPETKVDGKVVSITDYGAFVELEKGVEGLIHISEMSWTRHVKHPSKIVTIGQEVQAVVLSVDKDNEKISLGLKQTEPDPWDSLDEKYPIGSIVHGKVRNLTNFGAFVELEEGIDGLVHISDMSWTKRIRHPKEVLNKGDETEVVILDINKSIRRISLGLKQLTPDPWFDLTAKYTEGTFVEAKVSRPLERGVVVEMEEGVEGFIPVSHLGDRSIKKPVEHFAEGDLLPVKVINVDHDGRRIVLSVTDRLREEGSEALAEYMEKYGETRFPGATEEPEFDTEADDASPANADAAPKPVAETAEAPEAEEAAAPEVAEAPASETEEAPVETAASDEEDKDKPEQA